MKKYYLLYTDELLVYDDEKPNQYATRSTFCYESLKLETKIGDDIEYVLRRFHAFEITKNKYRTLAKKLNDIRKIYDKLVDELDSLYGKENSNNINAFKRGNQNELYIVNQDGFMKMTKQWNYDETKYMKCESYILTDIFDEISFNVYEYYHIDLLRIYSIIQKQDFNKLQNLFILFHTKIREMDNIYTRICVEPRLPKKKI